jgi:hypothetical protein
MEASTYWTGLLSFWVNDLRRIMVMGASSDNGSMAGSPRVLLLDADTETMVDLVGTDKTQSTIVPSPWRSRVNHEFFPPGAAGFAADYDPARRRVVTTMHINASSLYRETWYLKAHTTPAEDTGGASVSVIDPVLVCETGGDTITITGTFPIGEPFNVYFGPAGDATDPKCYGGESYGYSPMSVDGTTLAFVVPPTAPSTSYISYQKGLNPLVTLSSDPVTVIDRHWPNKQHSTRAGFPPWTGVGPRRLDLEGS